MIFTKLARLTSRKSLMISAFVISAFAASAGIVGIAQRNTAIAASNEVSVGQQVINTSKKKVTVKFVACKIPQGSGYYKVRSRAWSNGTAALGSDYRHVISSNLGSSTTAYKRTDPRLPQTSLVSNGKAKSSVVFSTYYVKGSSAGYTKTSGTTLRSFTVGSLPTC